MERKLIMFSKLSRTKRRLLLEQFENGELELVSINIKGYKKGIIYNEEEEEILVVIDQEGFVDESENDTYY